jgi:BirA family biotin operon repressor/biotin-[acetyl-CoA-carboxylase] ligase
MLSKSNPAENICVYSFHQQEGKGQFGRIWYSGRQNNISLSCLLHFHGFPAKSHFLLNKAISASVVKFLEDSFSINGLKIKWPNDIYFGEKKMGGLLVQNQLSGANIKSSIIGLGLNVNEDAFPEHLPNPVSLCQITTVKHELINLSISMADSLTTLLEAFLNRIPELNNYYLEHLLGYKQLRDYRMPDGQLLTGTIVSVNDLGKLNVNIANNIHSFDHKEIEFILT